MTLDLAALVNAQMSDLVGGGEPPPYNRDLQFIERLYRVIFLSLISNGADGLAVHAVFGIVAEKVYITQKIVLFLLHLLHDGHGGQHIIDCPVGIDHFAG